ncbi:hypothetical protein AVEN_120280-1 [Araneus ventricosus]|uniref:Uncharacterized protein n=1 Tax=Araneus ventricosus TaxID=182803 RepID=A0A4Y2A878_ARAVE|nr:hypothetical protein AVEN_120280-1 [Araneus ventricosus]
MSATMSQEKFLLNDNKQRLIKMLCVKFQKEGFVVKQTEEYADYLIIKSALEIEKKSQCLVVVGEDIDLLVIMTLSTNSENIFFLKPGIGEAGDALYCAATLNIAPHIRDNISFLHAFSGCDSISALFRQGKKTFMNVLNSTELQQVANIYRDENYMPGGHR